MKNYLFFAFILCSNFLFSQDFVGYYYKEISGKKGEIFEYSLQLNEDFTYSIEFKRKLNQLNSETEIFTGNGNWKQEKHKIFFYPKPCECEKEINLLGVTSRFKSKDSTELVFF